MKRVIGRVVGTRSSRLTACRPVPTPLSAYRDAPKRTPLIGVRSAADAYRAQSGRKSGDGAVSLGSATSSRHVPERRFARGFATTSKRVELPTASRLHAVWRLGRPTRACSRWPRFASLASPALFDVLRAAGAHVSPAHSWLASLEDTASRSSPEFVNRHPAWCFYPLCSP